MNSNIFFFLKKLQVGHLYITYLLHLTRRGKCARVIQIASNKVRIQTVLLLFPIPTQIPLGYEKLNHTQIKVL